MRRLSVEEQQRRGLNPTAGPNRHRRRAMEAHARCLQQARRRVKRQLTLTPRQLKMLSAIEFDLSDWRGVVR